MQNYYGTYFQTFSDFSRSKSLQLLIIHLKGRLDDLWPWKKLQINLHLPATHFSIATNKGNRCSSYFVHLVYTLPEIRRNKIVKLSNAKYLFSSGTNFFKLTLRWSKLLAYYSTFSFHPWEILRWVVLQLILIFSSFIITAI